eukprot:TRINITY_DN14697_c0_g1_i3.p1 TRINITY_DN14697_c0_g1~~TRINITY_DN14697_c0_g1_i3.p1  ORF type:complete len:489 (+),score=176.76 TRINITY_DN14697_c0_g1_i3:153-1619(+)
MQSRVRAMIAPPAVRSLYRSTLRAARELDCETQHPAKRALLLALPKMVWSEEMQRVLHLMHDPKSYEGLLTEFNRGQHFRPEGQSATEHVRKAWRSGVGSTTVAFEALKRMNAVLAAAKDLPAYKPPKRVAADRQQLRIAQQQQRVPQQRRRGHLLVGHPFAHVSDKLLHRSIAVVHPQQHQGSVSVMLLNKPSGRRLSEILSANYSEQYGPLLDHQVWVGGRDDHGFTAIHQWPDIPRSVEVLPNLYFTDLHTALKEGDRRPLDSLIDKAKGKKAAELPLRILQGVCSLKEPQLEASLAANAWLPLEQTDRREKKQLRQLYRDLLLSNKRKADPLKPWKQALSKAGSQASVLTAIPELTPESPFRPLCVAHDELLQEHIRKAMSRATKQKKKAPVSGGAGKRGPPSDGVNPSSSSSPNKAPAAPNAAKSVGAGRIRARGGAPAKRKALPAKPVPAPVPAAQPRISLVGLKKRSRQQKGAEANVTDPC